jgi:formylglycine-generating enzyme required for sulfatase activity
MQRRVREAIGQEPYLGFSALGDVYLAGLEPPRPPPVVAAPQPPPPVPALRLSEAAEAWDRTKDTTNLAVLEAFIARYKDTFYADLARARVDDLKKQQVALAPPPAKSEPAPAAKKTPGLIDQTLGIVLPPPSKQAPLNAPAGRCDGAQIAVGTANERRCVKPGAGKTEWFKDCPACPEMVVVPAGRFTMGSPAAEPERSDKEGPQKTVVFQKPFAVARVEVTIEQFDAFVTAAGQSPPGDCRTTDNIGRADRNYRDPGYGMTPIHPAACISWEDAVAYTAWLSKTTGKKYRLLSEAEWEYSARAGSTTAFWWGNEIGTNNANCHRCGSMWDSKQTAPVGSFASNAFGLHDMHGNVWEWVADCWNTYDSAKSDGWATADYQECHRAHRGGSFPEYSRFARSASRSVFAPNTRHYNGGFRVARTLD